MNGTLQINVSAQTCSMKGARDIVCIWYRNDEESPTKPFL